MLVGRNNTRRAYNMRMRQKQHIEDPLPVAGDKLVCLRNNRKKGLFNGGLWRVKARTASRSKSSRILSMRLAPDEEFSHKVTRVSVRQDCFEGGCEAIPWEQRKPYDEFDYGYVLTVHKSQGSQWDDVVLFDESFAFQDLPRAVAVYGDHAGGEEVERGGVTALDVIWSCDRSNNFKIFHSSRTNFELTGAADWL